MRAWWTATACKQCWPLPFAAKHASCGMERCPRLQVEVDGLGRRGRMGQSRKGLNKQTALWCEHFKTTKNEAHEKMQPSYVQRKHRIDYAVLATLTLSMLACSLHWGGYQSQCCSNLSPLLVVNAPCAWSRNMLQPFMPGRLNGREVQTWTV